MYKYKTIDEKIKTKIRSMNNKDEYTHKRISLKICIYIYVNFINSKVAIKFKYFSQKEYGTMRILCNLNVFTSS